MATAHTIAKADAEGRVVIDAVKVSYSLTVAKTADTIDGPMK